MYTVKNWNGDEVSPTAPLSKGSRITFVHDHFHEDGPFFMNMETNDRVSAIEGQTLPLATTKSELASIAEGIASNYGLRATQVAYYRDTYVFQLVD